MKRLIIVLLLALPVLLLAQSRGVPGPKKTHTLSGTITGVPATQMVEIRFADSATSPGVTIQVPGGSSWNWTQAVAGTYTVTPSHPVYTFTPKHRTIKVGGNVGNLNFQGSLK